MDTLSASNFKMPSGFAGICASAMQHNIKLGVCFFGVEMFVVWHACLDCP